MHITAVYFRRYTVGCYNCPFNCPKYGKFLLFSLELNYILLRADIRYLLIYQYQHLYQAINENLKSKEEMRETPFNCAMSADVAYFVHQWALYSLTRSENTKTVKYLLTIYKRIFLNYRELIKDQ